MMLIIIKIKQTRNIKQLANIAAINIMIASAKITMSETIAINKHVVTIEKPTIANTFCFFSFILLITPQLFRRAQSLGTYQLVVYNLLCKVMINNQYLSLVFQDYKKHK